MSANRFEFEMTIDDSMVDVLGHVNNAKYLEMFEAARWDLAAKSGFNLPESITKHRVAAIVLEINVKFKKELKSGDSIKIVSQYVSHTNKVFQVDQKIMNAKGQTAAQALVTLAAFDLTQRKITDIPKEWARAFDS